MRVVAVDWSGRAVGAHRFIWLAEVRNGVLTRLENGRSRDAVAAHLLELAAGDAGLVVGFDFSFSLPAWFLARRGFTHVADLWRAASDEGEHWLAACDEPFWGRPGRRRPAPQRGEPPLRVTEAALGRARGHRPKSTFQVGGAGSAGTGSIRGFPVLAALRRGGFAVWPFDNARLPLAVEVWPRACTGAVVKRDPAARAAFLDRLEVALEPRLRVRAQGSEDAFDAAVTALVMARYTPRFAALPLPADPAARREGWIWTPPAGGAADAEPARRVSRRTAGLAPSPRRGPSGGSPAPGSRPRR